MVGKMKQRPTTTTSLDELIDEAGGCAIVDGGFATQLEKHGAAINDPLWSAICLIKDPDLIKKVHMEYLQAGADVLVTSSYQATIPGFLSRGLSIEEGESLLKKSVTLAVEARNSFWVALKASPENQRYNRALVAASIGSYGAYLADGSEYSGDYGNVDLDKLKNFHRRRLQVLVEAGRIYLHLRPFLINLKLRHAVSCSKKKTFTFHLGYASAL